MNLVEDLLVNKDKSKEEEGGGLVREKDVIKWLDLCLNVNEALVK